MAGLSNGVKRMLGIRYESTYFILLKDPPKNHASQSIVIKRFSNF
jgi:hypothetical protein